MSVTPFVLDGGIVRALFFAVAVSVVMDRIVTSDRGPATAAIVARDAVLTPAPAQTCAAPAAAASARSSPTSLCGKIAAAYPQSNRLPAPPPIARAAADAPPLNANRARDLPQPFTDLTPRARLQRRVLGRRSPRQLND